MAFLKVNGWQSSAANGSVVRNITSQGTRGRGFRGQLNDPRRGFRREFTLDFVVQDPSSADPLEHMINGEGHMMDFADGLHAQTALNARTGRPRLILRPAALGAFGRGCLQVNSTQVAT